MNLEICSKNFRNSLGRDIAHVRNPRLRALFEGIAASYSIPEAYRAFEVLYEDYAPLGLEAGLSMHS